MVELLHDVNLLVDVLLQEGLPLDVQFADDLHRIQHISRSYVIPHLRLRAKTTSPNAPFPIDFIIS